MKAVIQRVSGGSVTIEENTKTIGKGLVILLGVGKDDSQDDVEALAKKTANLRIFSDDAGKMNLSICDVNGEVLVVSQFTLFAEVKKGNRPWFDNAAKPEVAIPLYEKFIQSLANKINKPIVTGQFGAKMAVSIQNDGPVTIVIDSKTDL